MIRDWDGEGLVLMEGKNEGRRCNTNKIGQDKDRKRFKVGDSWYQEQGKFGRG
jgi:hypothetical protein